MSSTATIDKPKLPPPDFWPPDDDGGGGGGDGDDDGTPSPHESGPPIPMARLATYFVLAMVLMLFAGFLSAYIILREGAKEWPPPGFPRVPRGLWVSTVLIMLSSVAGHFAMRAARRGDRAAMTRRIALTWTLGVSFCISQGVLWRHLLERGATPATDNYSGNFYALTGLHAAHVLGGIVFLGLCLFWAWSGRELGRLRSALSNGMLYWHFVGAIWLVLFGLLYTS